MISKSRMLDAVARDDALGTICGPALLPSRGLLAFIESRRMLVASVSICGDMGGVCGASCGASCRGIGIGERRAGRGRPAAPPGTASGAAAPSRLT